MFQFSFQVNNANRIKQLAGLFNLLLRLLTAAKRGRGLKEGLLMRLEKDANVWGINPERISLKTRTRLRNTLTDYFRYKDSLAIAA